MYRQRIKKTSLQVVELSREREIIVLDQSDKILDMEQEQRSSGEREGATAGPCSLWQDQGCTIQPFLLATLCPPAGCFWKCPYKWKLQPWGFLGSGP